MVSKKIYPSRSDWEEQRVRGLGGSDAAAVLGQSPWKTNVQLWEEKTGRRTAKDISDNPVVKFGTDAEQYIRGLFALERKDLTIHYEENNSFTNDRYPFARASLDGWTEEKNSTRKGILEIKTADIQSATQRQKWDADKMPQNYYCQVLFYMAVCEADYADLRAYLRHYNMDGTTRVKDYHIERSEVEADINYLMCECAKFWSYVTSGVEPPLKLNLN